MTHLNIGNTTIKGMHGLYGDYNENVLNLPSHFGITNKEDGVYTPSLVYSFKGKMKKFLIDGLHIDGMTYRSCKVYTH